MAALGELGFSLVERGLFDPAHTSEVVVYASWVTLCAVCYGLIAHKHRLGAVIAPRASNPKLVTAHANMIAC